MAEVKKWIGSTPDNCNLCHRKFEAVFYDASIPSIGSWGLLCHNCFTSCGCKLGTGCGQKYDLATLEKIGG